MAEEKETDPAEKPINHIAKPPPIYIDAQIIHRLIELLNNTTGKENYSIKQLKADQVKVQTSNPETFRKVTKALKEKNAEYHTYQLKADKSYKVVISLPLFLIELQPKNNNKEVFEIEKVLNTIVTVEPARHKKDIPQCIRCQQYEQYGNIYKKLLQQKSGVSQIRRKASNNKLSIRRKNK